MTHAQNFSNTRLTASVGVECHPGSVRTENQDRVSRASTPYGDLYVVADGVGGYQGGAEAAQAVVDGFARELSARSALPLDQALRAAAQSINRELEQRGLSQQTPSKMSSTVVLALIHGSTATIANVGDSRAYLIRNDVRSGVRGGALTQLTRDHSVMQRLIDEGVGVAEARQHESASVLTQALGQAGEVEIGVQELKLRPDDALLLCSDGLWGYASDAEIEAVAASTELSPAGCADALLHLALQGGGGDNISIQYLRFSAPPAAVARRARLFGAPVRVALQVAAGLAATFAVAAGLTIWNSQHGPLSSPPDAPAAPAVPMLPGALLKTRIRVMADDGRRAAWASRLSSLNYLEIAHVAVTGGCAAGERDGDTLLYTARDAITAKHIQKDLALPATALVAFEADSQDCGPGDLFALPARRSGLEELKRKAEQAAHSVGGSAN